MIRSRSLKTCFWVVLWVAASTGSIVACSQSQQTSAPNPSPMQGMDHSTMDHGTMNHSTMALGPADANFDLRFIDAMTPHHQGAVEMAKQAQQKSKRPEIKKLAADIIQAQNKEIAAMKQWRQAWYPKASNTRMAYNSKTGQMMPMSSDQVKGMMMNMNLGAADEQFDLRFIDAMIPHHESAVTMANEALSKSKRPEVKQLAQAIIASQQAEITQMQQWRKSWYNQ